MGRDAERSTIIQLFNDRDPICWLVNASRPISIVSHSSEYRTRSVFDPFVTYVCVCVRCRSKMDRVVLVG